MKRTLNRLNRATDGELVSLGCLFVIGLILLSWAVGTAVVYAGFNLVLVPIFGLSEIRLFQAWLLTLLIGFIGGCFKVVVSRR
jgi:hypothetical protein